MKSVQIKSFYYLLFSLIVVFSACKKDDDKPTPVDPFKIEQEIEAENIFFECDTCLQGKLRFRINDDKIEEAEWKIGNDTRPYTKRSFSLFFDNPSRDIKVSLIVKKKDGEQVSDTITKTIQVFKWEEATYYGKYQGYEESNQNTIFNIEIKRYDTLTAYYPQLGCNTNPCVLRSVIKNLPKDCDGEKIQIYAPVVAGSYRHFRIATEGYNDYCQDVIGTGSLDANGNIIINYSVKDKNNNYKYVPKKFIGKKIK